MRDQPGTPQADLRSVLHHQRLRDRTRPDKRQAAGGTEWRTSGDQQPGGEGHGSGAPVAGAVAVRGSKWVREGRGYPLPGNPLLSLMQWVVATGDGPPPGSKKRRRMADATILIVED